MNSNQNVKKPADASKNTQHQDQDKDKTAKKGAQGAMNSGEDREDEQGDDVIGTQHGHTNKAMGNAANPGQHQKDNAGTGHNDGGHDKNKSKDAGGHDKHQGPTDKHQGSSDKNQGSGGGQHKH